MASNTPFGYPISYNVLSYTDLLNQTTTQPTPALCTQTPPSDADRGEANSPGTFREGRRRWTVPEDRLLISAWLNTSKDPIVGNEQKLGTFWKRVAKYYSASAASKELPPREWNTCKQRWGKINEAVQKFCGCYEQANRQRTSGQSDDDVFQVAYNFYFQDQKNNFTLDHAWRVLRNDQKWCSESLDKGKSQSLDKGKSQTKRTKPGPSGLGIPMEDQPEERPIGVKAAKAAKLKGSTKATNEDREARLKNLENVWVIREKDFANKDKLADKKVLANLLAKTEPLTEMEIELKTNLISPVYGSAF